MIKIARTFANKQRFDLLKLASFLFSCWYLYFQKKPLKNNELTRKLVNQDLLNVQVCFQIYYW